MYFNDLKVGLREELKSVTVEKDKMKEFARFYDDIPLHTDEEYAKNTPFKQIIAPGMFSFLSVWAEYLKVDFFGEELLAGKSTKVEWFKPVFACDELKGIATVTSLTERNEKNGIAEVTIEVFNQTGELVLSSVTEAIIKKRTNAEKQ